MNPLDWTAGPFLGFYISVAAMVIASVLLLRARIGDAASGDPRGLGLLEMAYLAGGRERAADTVLVGFFVAGAATLEPKRSRIAVDAAAAPLPEELEAFRHSWSGVCDRARCHAAIRTTLDQIQARLIQRGLVPQPGVLASLRAMTLLLMAIPIASGVAKIAVGSARGKPVGILTLLVIGTAFLALVFIARSPLRTRAGKAALQASRHDHARAARAPLARELPLAFALTGAAVLAGTPYSAFARQVSSSDGGGGSDGGGDGGGGGCGGCS